MYASRTVLFVFFASRIVILVGLLVAPEVIPEYFDPSKSSFYVHVDAPRIIDGLIRWDGVHYLSIARDGYYSSSNTELNTARFWPLYPFLVWLFGSWGGEQGLIYLGLALSNLSFLVFLFLFYHMVAQDLGQRVASYAALYISIFP